MSESRSDNGPGLVAALDDDPTGPQHAHETPVALDWSDDVVRQLPERSFHLITNTRAVAAPEAETVTREAAEAVLRRFPAATVILRGDSTLRAHLRPEYKALCDAAFGGSMVPLLLVPALPSAGRITLDGVHLLRRNGSRTPLSETEYARDGGFSYSSSHLLEWAQERSAGLFRAADGVMVPLAELRRRGGAAVHAALRSAAAQDAPVACVPDALEIADLVAIADGFRAARRDGLPMVVRCAPTFAGVLSRTLAPHPVAVPHASSLLIVCGSHVPQTTRQLERLLARHPGVLVELSLRRLLGAEREDELARAIEAARRLLAAKRLAVLATPRTRDPIADDPAAAGRISDALAALTGRLAADAGLLLLKGGITAAKGIREGLQVEIATVEGPVGSGVALWRVAAEGRCLVFPGNVGDDDTLAELTSAVLG